MRKLPTEPYITENDWLLTVDRTERCTTSALTGKPIVFSEFSIAQAAAKASMEKFSQKGAQDKEEVFTAPGVAQQAAGLELE